jgi:hypothetical protein
MNRSYARLVCNNKTFSVVDAPRGRAQSNWFEVAPAGHVSEGRVLMKAYEFKELEAQQTDAQQVDLIFGTTDTKSEQDSQKMTMKVRVIGATPFVTSSNVDVNYDKDMSDTVEVTVVGYNWWLERTSTTTVNYNVQNGFGVDGGGAPRFRQDAAHESQITSWSTLPTVLGYSVAQSADFVAPPKEIRNLHSIGRPKVETVRRVAEGLGLIFDSVTLKIWNKGQSSTTNVQRSNTFSDRVVDKHANRLSDDRFPTQVKVGFLRVGYTEPESIEYYTKSTPRGSQTVARNFMAGHWIAVKKSDGTIANNSELDSLATWFSTGKGNALDIHDFYGHYKFAGIINFTIDGMFRRILWTCNAHEVSTVVSVNSNIPIRAREDDREDWFAAYPILTSRSLDGTSLAIDTRLDPIDAILTGSQELSTNRWKYAWTSATLSGDTWVKDNPPRASGTASNDYALNKNENANTANWTGPGTLVGPGSGYPTTYKLVPVGQDRNGTVYDYPVTIHRSIRADGSIQHWFHVENDHDGQC